MIESGNWIVSVSSSSKVTRQAVPLGQPGGLFHFQAAFALYRESRPQNPPAALYSFPPFSEGGRGSSVRQGHCKANLKIAEQISLPRITCEILYLFPSPPDGGRWQGEGGVTCRRCHPSPQPSPLKGERGFPVTGFCLHQCWLKSRAFFRFYLASIPAKSLPDSAGTGGIFILGGGQKSAMDV